HGVDREQSLELHDLTSVPVPTLVSLCSTRAYERRNQRDTATLYDSGAALDLTFLRSARGNAGRNVKSAAPVGELAVPITLAAGAHRNFKSRFQRLLWLSRDGTRGGMKRLAYIDALRGYAILGVMVVHSAQLIPDLSAPWRALTNQGARGVQLFF